MVAWVSPLALQEDWKSFTVGLVMFMAHAGDRVTA